MTSSRNTPNSTAEQPWLSFSPDDLASVRVNQAEFSRLFDVSRQTVSQWVKKGIVTTAPDGLIDLRRATREVIQKADPKTIRARLFRTAMQESQSREAEIEELGGRVADLDMALAKATDWGNHLECSIDRYQRLLEGNAGQLRDCTSDAALRDLIGDLWFQADEECAAAHVQEAIDDPDLASLAELEREAENHRPELARRGWSDAEITALAEEGERSANRTGTDSGSQ